MAVGGSGLGCSCAQPALWFFQSSRCWYRVSLPHLQVLLGSLGGHSLCRLGCCRKEPPLHPRLVEGHREMTFHGIMGSFRLENPSKSLSPNP